MTDGGNRAQAYFDRLQMFGMKLGLENIARLDEALGYPGRRDGFIHLAGSNGKGSTGAMLQAMLRKAGFKTGFYTSPHLITPRERIRIDGKGLSEEAWLDCFDRVRETAEKAGLLPTYFEFHTAMALTVFRDAEVDFAVWETGMGGRLDATNVIARPEAAVITGIALEHCRYLGDSLGQIAAEKAGIIKPGAPVFAGVMPEEARQVIEAKARELGCPFFRAEEARRDYGLALKGAFQRRNLGLALQVIDYLSGERHFDLAQALDGLKTVRWPGRMQEAAPGQWIDGGHNPDGIAALTATLFEASPGEKFHFIFGALSDKEADCELALLAEAARSITFVPVRGGELNRAGHDPAALAESWKRLSPAPAALADDVLTAWRRTPAPKVLCGSLYLAGELLKGLFGEEAALNI